MTIIRALHACAADEVQDDATLLRCAKPASLYRAKRGEKTYALCLHHASVFDDDLHPIGDKASE